MRLNEYKQKSGGRQGSTNNPRNVEVQTVTQASTVVVPSAHIADGITVTPVFIFFMFSSHLENAPWFLILV